MQIFNWMTVTSMSRQIVNNHSTSKVLEHSVTRQSIYLISTSSMATFRFSEFVWNDSQNVL